jgi:hypothetical protein
LIAIFSSMPTQVGKIENQTFAERFCEEFAPFRESRQKV